MTETLLLNDYNIRTNPRAGAHDPSMMYDPVSKNIIRIVRMFTDLPWGLRMIGIPVRSSGDLVHFKYEGTVLSENAVEQARITGHTRKP